MTKCGVRCVKLACEVVLALVVSAWVLLVVAAVSAQPLPEPPSYVLHHGTDGGWLECDGTVDCTRIPGKRGVWFEMPVAEQLVREHRVYPELQKITLELERKVSATEERFTLCLDRERLAVAQAHAAAASIDDALAGEERANERAKRAEAQRDAWHRSPLLWYSAGLLTSVVVLGTAIGLAN